MGHRGMLISPRERLLWLLMYVGDTPFRHIIDHTILVCHTACREVGRKATLQTRCWHSYEVHLLCDVDASHHALAWWFHDSCCFVQVRYREEDSNSGIEQGWNETKDCSCYEYVCCSICEYVDQQCSSSSTLLFYHSGMQLQVPILDTMTNPASLCSETYHRTPTCQKQSFLVSL